MLQTAPRRRLKPFREVTKNVGIDRQVRRLAEEMDLTEAQNLEVDLNYFTLSIPMRLSDEEKQERLADMVDTVQAIEGSDVVLLGMWVSLTTE
jgi:hypothetical protein